MTFHDPALLLLALPILLFFGYDWRSKTSCRILFPTVSLLSELPVTARHRCVTWLPLVRILALLLVVFVLARPQMKVRESTVVSRGIDLVVALDISTSMLAVDRPVPVNGHSRFQIARDVTRDFISRRSGDRIGLIAFAARPYPAAPLTLDHQWLSGTLDQLAIGTIEDGTALGDAMLAAVNRLRSSPPRSRAVVLVTDGRNNAGVVDPSIAAEAARSLGIRVHTVGIGGRGGAEYPVEDPLGGITYRQVAADLDEVTLANIAAATGGTYFRATDSAALQKIFIEIDRLERHPIKEKVNVAVREVFTPFLLAALFLLTVDMVLRTTWLRRFP